MAVESRGGWRVVHWGPRLGRDPWSKSKCDSVVVGHVSRAFENFLNRQLYSAYAQSSPYLPACTCVIKPVAKMLFYSPLVHLAVPD